MKIYLAEPCGALLFLHGVGLRQKKSYKRGAYSSKKYDMQERA